MFCSETWPLWKLVNQLDWTPGRLQKRNSHTIFPNHLILPVKKVPILLLAKDTE